MLLGHRAEDGRDQAGACAARRPRHRRDRVALVAMAEDRPPGSAALADLAHLGLGEQDHVARHLGQHPGARPARRPARPAGPGRCARARRLGQAELPGEPASTTGRGRRGRPGCRPPRRAGRRGRPGRPGEPRRRLVESGQPAGRLEPERGRDRLLQQGPPGHQRVAVLGGQAGAGVGGAGQIVQSGRSARRATSMAAVSSTSWLVAPLWTWSATPAGPVGELADQRHDRVAGGRRRAPSSARSNGRPGTGGDHLGGLGREQPGLGPPGPGRPRCRAWPGATPRRRPAATWPRARTPPNKTPQMAKNTVSCSPWRRMSKR